MANINGVRTIWIKGSDGRPDAVLSFATAAVAVILFKILFAGLTITLGRLVFAITAPDATTIGTVFTPTLLAYVSNKYVSLNYHPDYIKMRQDAMNGSQQDQPDPQQPPQPPQQG